MLKKILPLACLFVFVSNSAFASFPVQPSSISTYQDEATKEEPIFTKREVKRQEKLKAKIVRLQEKAEKQQESSGGYDKTTAIILGFVSVLLFPFALHNWYIGENKKALWQCLMVIPGFILLGIPTLISWVWQIVDLVNLF